MSGFSSGYDHLFRILIVGDKGVGKTSLRLRFIDNIHADLPHTEEHATKTINIDDKNIKLQIWDYPKPSGRFDNLQWLKVAQAYILAFDLSNKESFENLQHWRTDIHGYGKSDARVLMVGCKADREAERAVSPEEVDAYCRKNNIPYIETSSKTGENVEQAFSRLAGECLKQEKLRPPAATIIDARERAPNPTEIKSDFIEELRTRIEVLRSEISQLFSANKDLKRQKIETLGALRDELLRTITPISELVHRFRTTYPFLDKGKHSHRTKDLLNKYDKEGPVSK